MVLLGNFYEMHIYHEIRFQFTKLIPNCDEGCKSDVAYSGGTELQLTELMCVHSAYQNFTKAVACKGQGWSG